MKMNDEKREKFSKLATTANKKVKQLQYNDTDSIKVNNEYKRALENLKTNEENKE